MSVDSLKALFRRELEQLRAYRVPPAPPAVKLDANESPWGLPGEAWETVLTELRNTPLHRYPDGRATALRAALANSLGGTPEQFVLGSGSDELIALVATAMSRPRDDADRPVVLYPEPTFVMYGLTSLAQGWKRVGVALDDAWDLHEGAMAAALQTEKPNVVYYARPNNPTGNAFTRERVEALVDGNPETLHVIDEAYDTFGSDSLSAWCADRPHCALMGTLSKIGFAAIRVGWLRLHEDFAAELDKVRQPFNLNSLSQRVATLALTELAPLLRSQARTVVAERGRLTEAISQHDRLRPYPSAANFLLVEVEGDVAGLCEALRGREIAVRRFANGHPRLAQCVRITVGTSEENERLLTALEAVL